MNEQNELFQEIQKVLFQEIQKVLAGHSERAVTHALLTSLIVAIGVGAETLPRAIAVIDALPTKMKPILRDKWNSFRDHRARSELHTSVGVKFTQSRSAPDWRRSVGVGSPKH